MCRISGTVGYSKDQALKILDHQKRGGPDLSRLMIDENIHLGHNLLSIIGHTVQPIKGDRYIMTFNGCIYNYKEIDPYATSDTEVLLNLFDKKGLKALDDLNGMFAIGLYDAKKEKIHLIVDRFGQKQLYYTHQGDKFAFASNPGALYDLLDRKEIDKDALQSYWLLGSVMGENGILKGIKKVCASEIVTFDIKTNQVSTSRWYEPKFHVEQDLEGLIYDAIDKVKVADVPVYILLSGGIDSTLVASRNQNGNAIHLDGPELPYAELVAKKYNVNLKVVNPEDFKPETVLSDYSEFSGEPTMAGMIPYITVRELSKFARVGITANGADELFFGYNRTKQDTTDFSNLFRWNTISWNEQLDYINCTAFGGGRRKELDTYVQFDLNKTLDYASMAHGVEMRSPFLDHRLVEAALSIPESIHRKRGNKTILKDILLKMGFDRQFTDRPKLGFSLFKKPIDIQDKLNLSWHWVKKEGFLECDKLNGRDEQYLKMSALGFYYWHKTIFK